MEKNIRLGLLYDFYGEMLPEHGREILARIIEDDLSLSEIADLYSITRQGVHDVKKRYAAALENYEAKLHLLDKYQAARERLVQMEEIIAAAPEGQRAQQQKLYALAKEIVDAM